MSTRKAFARGILTAAAFSAPGCGPLHARLARAVHGCPDAPPDPPHATPATERVRLPSRLVPGGEADVIVLHPARALNRVVIALPGRGGTAADAAGDIGSYTLANAPASAFVCVGGGESYWHPRVSGEDRLEFLLETVLPWIRSHLGAPPPYGIAGWSMGAFGALAAAEHAPPETFDRVCAVSPAIWSSRADQRSSVSDAFDGDADFAAYGAFAHAAALRPLDVRIVCGTGDAFYENARAFAKVLEERGGRVRFVPIQRGCHEMETWHRTMPQDLAFAGGVSA